MPSSSCTAPTPFPLAACCIATIQASLYSFIGEVFSMFQSMAMNAKTNTIINIKSKIFKCTETFDMMSVKISDCITFLTSIIVSFKNFFAPKLKIIAMTSANTIFSSSSFPGSRFFTNPRLSSTGSTTKNLWSISRPKIFFAGGTIFCRNRISLRPAFFATKFRIFSSIIMFHIFNRAYSAYKNISFMTRWNRLSFNGWHVSNYTGLQKICTAYCDIIVRRYINFIAKERLNANIKRNGEIISHEGFI